MSTDEPAVAINSLTEAITEAARQTAQTLKEDATTLEALALGVVEFYEPWGQVRLIADELRELAETDDLRHWAERIADHAYDLDREATDARAEADTLLSAIERLTWEADGRIIEGTNPAAILRDLMGGLAFILASRKLSGVSDDYAITLAERTRGAAV